MLHLDHILYAVPHLQQGMEDFEKLTGVRPAYGGQHPHRGTHNALVSLGEDVYFELISPDPSQPISREKLPFDIGNITVPKIITWAVRSTNIQALGATLQLSDIKDGKRITAAGTELQWKTADITACTDASGIVPFVIQWVSALHPARTAPSGCELLQFSAAHPSPKRFAKLFSQCAFDVHIVASQSWQLTMKINTPNGVIDIS